MTPSGAVDIPSDHLVPYGGPKAIRRDTDTRGSPNEVIGKAARHLITAVGANTIHITPPKPWENGFLDSFEARPRDTRFGGVSLYDFAEARIIIERRRRYFTTL